MNPKLCWLFTAFLLVLTALASAQQPRKILRIGFLSPFSSSDTPYQAFGEGLRDHGWIEGKNISVQYRYANGAEDRLPGLVAELLDHKVDVIVTSVTTDTLAAKHATATVPIVMAAGDPLATGIIASLARPDGNITGLSQMAPELSGKRLEVLKEMVPKLSRVGALWNPEIRVSTFSWKEMQDPARQLKIRVDSLEVRSPDDLERAFDAAVKAHVDAVVVMPDPVTRTSLRRIANLAVEHRLPSVFHIREFAEVGGLIAYGPDRSDLFRRAASYVDKILKGAKPADLPVQQPTKFELVINLKTAKQIGLTIPPNVLARADRVVK